MRTVGIDLSLRATGIARSDGWCGLVGRDGVTTLSVDVQIVTLNDLLGLIARLCWPDENDPPDAACIEGLDMARSYGGQIERSVLWWGVVSWLRVEGIPVFVAPSAQIKIYATGSGNPAATRTGRKSSVIEAVGRLWPQFDIGTDDNKADAAVCALIAAHMLGEPIHPEDPEFAPLPDTHVRALTGIRSTTDPPSRRQTPGRLTHRVAPA